MADEHGATIIGGIETEVHSLVKDVAELKGAFGQMDKRLSNVESAIGGLRQEVGSIRQEIGGLRHEIGKDSRQVRWTVLGTWIATMLTIPFKH